MKKTHYAWTICFACMLMLFCTIGFNTTIMSVHFPYIRESFGFTNTQTSSLYSIRMFASILGLFFVDALINRVSPKGCAVIGMGCLCFGTVMFLLARNYLFFVLGSVINGFAYGFGSMVVAAVLIGNWFKKRRGLAISICSAGSGLCSVIVSPSVTWITEKYGLRTAFSAETVFLILVTVTISLLIKNTPEEAEKSPYDADIVEVKAELPRESAGIGSKLTILLCVGTVLLGFQTNCISGQTANLFVTAGFDPMIVSTILSVYGFVMFFGKLLFGQFADKFGGFKANAFFTCFCIAGCLLNSLANLHSVPLAFIGICLCAIGVPTGTVGITLNAQSLFEKDEFVKIQKILQIMFSIGGVLSGTIAGAIADATGSFVMMEQIITVVSCVYLIIIVVCYRKLKRTS